MSDVSPQQMRELADALDADTSLSVLKVREPVATLRLAADRLETLEAQLASRDRDVEGLVRTLESVSKREDELEALLRETVSKIEQGSTGWCSWCGGHLCEECGLLHNPSCLAPRITAALGDAQP